MTAWDTFSTLLAGAKTYTNGVGEPEFKEIRGERIAWRRNGDAWHVMHSAPVICQTMGAPRWIERYGSEWVRRGWLRPGKEGKAYKQAKPPGEDRPVWVLILEPFKTSPQEGGHL